MIFRSFRVPDRKALRRPVEVDLKDDPIVLVRHGLRYFSISRDPGLAPTHLSFCVRGAASI